VSAEEQVRLGGSAPLGSGDPFAWLAALPGDAPCQVSSVEFFKAGAEKHHTSYQA